MLISHQLPVVGKALQRFLFEDAIVTPEIIEHKAIEHEKACAGAAADFCLFLKFGYATGRVCVDDPEAGARRDGRDRGQLAMAFVEFKQLSDVYITYAIAIGQHEEIVTNVLLRSEEHTSELQSPCNLVCRL